MSNFTATLPAARPCPGCNKPPRVEWYVGWACSCDDCLDPVDDAPDVAKLQGHGDSAEEAISNWNELVAEYIEANWTDREVLERIAASDAAVDAGGTDCEAERAVGQQLRAEMTRRHHAVGATRVRLLNPEPEDIGNDVGVVVEAYPHDHVKVRWADGAETIVSRERVAPVGGVAA